MAEKIKTPGLDELIANADRSSKAISMPGLDSYISAIEGVAPIKESSSPRDIGEFQKQGQTPYQEPSFDTRIGQIGKSYLDTVGEHAESAVDTFRSGAANLVQGRVATGVGKLGLGAIGYPLSPITGGLHEFVGKPAAKIGGADFGEKAELLAGSSLPVGIGTRAIQKALPANQAIKAITNSIAPTDLIEGLNRLKSNPRLSVMDVFPSVKQMGQKLILTEGAHQNKFTKFIEERIGGRREAIEDIFHETTGMPPNVLIKVNQLKQNIKDAGKEINPLLETAKPVNMSGVVASIDTKLKPGINTIFTAGDPLPLGDVEKSLKNVRKLITDDKSLRTDANQLHIFQSALRAKAEDLIHSATGQDRQLGHSLMNVRNQTVKAIDEAAPGYAEKLANYRDQNQIDEAFKKGYLLVRNKAGNWEDRPEFWEQWIKTVSKEEREAAREGAKVAFDDAINGTRYAGRKAMDIPETPFNQDKIGMLFGKKEANEMASRLRDERGMSEVNADMIKGSQTAMRVKSDSNITNPSEMKFKSLQEMAIPMAITEAASVAGMRNMPGIATAVIAAGSVAKRLTIDKSLRQYERNKNNRLTDLLTSTGPDRDALIQMLESHLPQAKLSLSQKAKLLTGGNP